MLKWFKDVFEPTITISKERWDKIKKAYEDMVEYVTKYETIIFKAERVIKLGALEADFEARKLLAEKDKEIKKLKRLLEIKEKGFNALAKDYYELTLENNILKARCNNPTDPARFKKMSDYVTGPSYDDIEEEYEEMLEEPQPVVTLKGVREKLKDVRLNEIVSEFDDYIETHKFDKRI